MAWLAAIGALAGAGASFLGASKTSREAAKSRRAGEKIAEESLAFARELYKNFEPVIKNTTDFFANVPLEDIASGKVLATGVPQAINALNTGTRDAERQIQADLARRGVSNSPAGQGELSEFRLKKAEAASALSLSGINEEINRRLALTRLGTGAAGAQIDVASSIADRLQGRSSQLSQEAGALAGIGGQSLADLLSNESFQGLFKKKSNIRKDPTTLD